MAKGDDMKLLIEIELDTDERMYYSELGRMVEKSLRLYHDAVAMGELPANEDSGVIHDTHGNQVGNWKATNELPIPRSGLPQRHPSLGGIKSHNPECS
jgi:hypothetical protein